MDVDDEDEDGIDGEEEKGVNSYGLSVGLHAPKFQLFVVTRKLEQQTWLQQHEQYHSY